jgi:hypothetical protein
MAPGLKCTQERWRYECARYERGSPNLNPLLQVRASSVTVAAAYNAAGVVTP